MGDFHDLIVYFMDTDLRTMFVQATTPVLSQAALTVATDDAAYGNGENKLFYQKLQVPYIVSMLAAGKYCNGRRADAKLKEIPTDSAVFQRHSAKLYRAHYMEQLPSINDLLQEQHDNEYSDRIDDFVSGMKENIAAKSANLKVPSNSKYDAQLAAAQKDIDNLITWAKQRSLWWDE
ncbi:uncharacterized protein FOBCDRAFT_204107 [Fusarium oxysporum Fo47]|uniref:uncharacterized protein n=1 Tax=Fusarium oxysporum Fo47 TaxID=660027 RepID=UPI002869A01C|nr:uncharacterized protein FOBCDRAFT_204107 [Fusarium oxysporum Fo47]QKD57104.2 hypothetical protein FOBCDRAFT_204107 [Fusarium oxysporum Fo47]